MKVCHDCKLPKDESEFHKNRTRPDGLQARCKPCHTQRARDTYRKNPTRAMDQARAFKRDKRQWIFSLKNRPCIDCGGVFHPECMDFDHMDHDEKELCISAMYRRNFSREKILAEVDKCEVVCSNCHRMRTKARSEGKPYDFYVGYRYDGNF